MQHTSRCGGTVYALVSKTSPREGLRVRIPPPALPIHRLPLASISSSKSLFFVHRSPPNLLLSIGFAVNLNQKIRYTGCFVAVEIHEKTRNEIVQNHFLVAGSLSSKKHTLRNETPFFTTLSHTLDTITLTHNAALLSGLCLLTFHVLLMSLNLCELFDLKLLLIACRCYS